MDLKSFENDYWQRKDQGINFRNKVAFELVKKGPVLDLGCENGLLLEMLKKKKIDGVGLEISEVAVNKAKKKGLDVRQFDFSANKLPFSGNSFETVILLDVLEHLYQPEKVLKEAHRVTKKNLVLGVPNFVSLPARTQVLLGKTPENNTLKKGHVFWITYLVLKEMLQRNNFRIVEMKTNTFFSRVPIVKKILQILVKLRPQIFALSFVIKAVKK